MSDSNTPRKQRKSIMRDRGMSNSNLPSELEIVQEYGDFSQMQKRVTKEDIDAEFEKKNKLHINLTVDDSDTTSMVP